MRVLLDGFVHVAHEICEKGAACQPIITGYETFAAGSTFRKSINPSGGHVRLMTSVRIHYACNLWSMGGG